MTKSVSREVEFRKRRVALQGAVRVTQADEEPEVLKYIDLSMGGLFVKSMFPLEVGTAVDLELRLWGLPFKASATVAWIRPYDQGPDKPTGMGIRFQELSPVQRKALYRQVAQAIEQGAEAMPGTPPSPAQLAARGKSAKGGGKKGSLWSRLTRSSS